ncbi:MAG: peptidase M23 family protein [candidate division Kazan bacterium GW2011_GWA1_50_15]|uniref:Peptidase M23 family protein n=2 Tax=Bacteria division Kazan-3B-28 TaxID=1798534 RepID=A0A0G2A413_UNCK3|nr:MAG: peptidase M23 family protein [candidate division Kazan bacterium GW2011_GWA1_50_15]KKW25659.1 MAG: Peptidase M23 family protein [candidate division Kazan bacterium GW2011_GWC1_52_13]KKW26964.1 MAG: Peptidase M23 family protein [candidate division Kazan bacterium GW2011_GWB1_52_7]HAV66132.1 hypothetical protein [Patescibacteria group bacterium]HCR42663.1 hypothetical protein [Patescibacteria group bacterium]
MPRLSFKPIYRSLNSFGSHWAIVTLAITVIFSGLIPRPAAVAVGGEVGQERVRYRTVAELASTEYFNEDVVYDEVITTVGDNGDYIFKTGATETIISRNSRHETIVYEVKPGESVSSVARDFGLGPDTLRYANKLTGNGLTAEQKLKIPPIDGIYITVNKNDTLSTIAKRYKVNVADIVKYNAIDQNAPIFSGQELLIPGMVAPKSSGGSQYVPSGNIQGLPNFNPTSGTGQFIWPLESPTHFISQGYRAYHKALDLNRLNGWGIYASAAGIVRTYSVRGGYGNYIDINHGNGWVTRYAHLSQFKVNSGDYVQQGQLIGIMGSTGRSTGPHLHFEIRYNGTPLNPLSYLPR